jgi:hypothetical protein
MALMADSFRNAVTISSNGKDSLDKQDLAS